MLIPVAVSEVLSNGIYFQIDNSTAKKLDFGSEGAKVNHSEFLLLVCFLPKSI